MAQATIIAQIWVCVDCMIDHENEGKPFTTEDVTSNFDANEEDGIHEFSSQRCDGCSTALAGSRYRYAVWGNA